MPQCKHGIKRTKIKHIKEMPTELTREKKEESTERVFDRDISGEIV